jgi:hypothetical protein
VHENNGLVRCPVKLMRMFRESLYARRQHHPFLSETGKDMATLSGASTGAGYVRDPFVFCIGDDIEQLFKTIASDRRDDAKLGKMSTDRIDHGGLLTNKQVPGAMKYQATLLLRRLGLDKSHVGSGDGLADRFSIGGIILLSLDVGPDIGRSPDYLALRAALVNLAVNYMRAADAIAPLSPAEPQLFRMGFWR